MEIGSWTWNLNNMLLTIIAFVFVLGILIIAHELGHFLAAKWSGVKVLEFSIGFPPRILSFKRGETKYTIGSLPIGGYVKMLGEEEVSKDPRAYNNQSPGKRLLIGVAGVFLNLVLAWIILSIGFAVGMTPLASSSDQIPGKKIKTEIFIAEVMQGSPAEKAGLKAWDTLKSATTSNGETVTFGSASTVGDFTRNHLGQQVTLEVVQDKNTQTKQIEISTNSESPLGIGIVDQSTVRVPWYKAPFVALKETFKMAGVMLDFLRQFFAKLLSSGEVSREVGGPVAIFSMSGMAARAGLMVFFQFIAMLSVNLALINILPFPALDGGRVLFVLFEKIAGKRIIKEEVENIIHLIGFALLILLILAITYKDILRLIGR